MTFVDTSVIVTASQARDPRHHACIRTLAKMDVEGGACATHTLSEVFSVLTRLPLPYRVPAPSALQIVQHTARRFKLVNLTAQEHLAAIECFVALGWSGAMIFDALILGCARKIVATRIYTLDPRHFRRIAPDLSSRIVEP